MKETIADNYVKRQIKISAIIDVILFTIQNELYQCSSLFT